MNKTIALFSPGQTAVIASTPLYQYDYGQILEISGLELPETFTVDFGGVCDAETKPWLGANNSVVIPDEYLQTGQSINAYIFLHTGADDGETEYKISIVVIPRPERSQETPTPQQQSVIDQAIAALNAGVESASASAASAALAASHYPKIIDGEWYIWSVEADAYISTGIAAQGEDGYSPTVQVMSIEGGHRVTITDATGPHTFDVMDGQGGGAGAVESVNGQTGAVELDAEDVGALPNTTTLDSLPDGTTYKRATATQLSQIAENTQDIGALETAVDDIEALIPAAASASNQLADKAFVNSSVQTNTAHFRGNWATWDDVPSSAADYPADDDGNTTPTTNDYMAVQDASGYPVASGEDALTGTWRFKYTGIWAGYGKSGWHPEYQVNETPLTAAQLAALNSGATAAIISSVADKLDKTGDGSDVTTAFGIASTRANIATGEKLSVLFGKIAKWFSDLGTAAFRAATATLESGSTALIESGAVFAALAGKLSTSTKYASSASVGGPADKTVSIPMGAVDSTSTATAFTATIDGITELRSGVLVWLTNGVVTSAAGCTLNINGLGAKPIYNSIAEATATTTTFNINYTMLFVYNASRVAGGCWDMVYGYDANTTYTPSKLGFGYATCTTAAATAAKTASLSSYTLTANGLVAVKFSNDVPASATLNINSKGAKAIYYKGAAIEAGVIKGGDTALFVYSTYYHLLSIDRWGTDITSILTAFDNKQAKITASGILKGDGNGGVSAATAGTDYGTYSKPSGGIPASDLASGVIPTVPGAYTLDPAALGTASPGSSGSWARGDHVHPNPTPADIGAEPATVVVTVTGTTPTITAEANHRYICGEVATLDLTPPASGICDVIFESGSTATVLTVPSTVRWAGGFDPTSLDADTTYELNIMDGLGVAASWD